MSSSAQTFRDASRCLGCAARVLSAGSASPASCGPPSSPTTGPGQTLLTAPPPSAWPSPPQRSAVSRPPRPERASPPHRVSSAGGRPRARTVHTAHCVRLSRQGGPPTPSDSLDAPSSPQRRKSDPKVRPRRAGFAGGADGAWQPGLWTQPEDTCCLRLPVQRPPCSARPVHKRAPDGDPVTSRGAAACVTWQRAEPQPPPRHHRAPAARRELPLSPPSCHPALVAAHSGRRSHFADENTPEL